ncbi:MAG: thioredoxin-like domain-containing protein [Opitutales bacterium]
MKWTDVQGRTATMRLLEVHVENDVEIGQFLLAGHSEPIALPLTRLCLEDRAYIEAHREAYEPPNPLFTTPLDERSLTDFEYGLRAGLTMPVIHKSEVRLERVSPLDLPPKHFYILYYASRDNPAALSYTANLKRRYLEAKVYRDDFELIFMALDDREATMIEHIRLRKMPWYVVAHRRVNPSHEAMKISAVEDPQVFVVDANGQILFKNSTNKKVSDEVKRVFATMEEIVPMAAIE